MNTLLSSLNDLLLVRYFEVSALTCALYDHSLTFSDEVATMWTRNAAVVPQVLYIVLRYGIECILLYFAHLFSGFSQLDENTCKTFIVISCCANYIFAAATQIYAIYHHYLIWDRRHSALVALIAALVATFIPSLYLGVTGVLQYRKQTEFLEVANACLLPEPSGRIIAAWACLSTFDALAIAIVALNSFHRPYRRRSDIVSSLLRDGIMWFLVIFGLSILNVIVVAATPAPSNFVIGFHVWAFMCIIQGRFILRAEVIRSQDQELRRGIVTISKVSESYTAPDIYDDVIDLRAIPTTSADLEDE